MLDVKVWLESTGMKVAQERFLKPPALPYIIFLETSSVSGADNKNCISDRSISIELYSDKINKASEGAIEDLLNEKAIEYSKDRTWIDSEKFFQTVYDFNLIEKF
ncbi:hypothetical protein [Clostridium thailandense]|uniref:hypothetical protein n=1 Tax=Clostridium thailandense TaxID=2794346 RepID=UPI003989EFFA